MWGSTDLVLDGAAELVFCFGTTRRMGDWIVPRRSLKPDFHSHFEQTDPILFEVVRQVGPFQLTLERNRFRMLVASIISQQLSTAAARTIRLRLESTIAPGGLTPEAISGLDQT